jgi:hypothetical protein
MGTREIVVVVEGEVRAFRWEVVSKRQRSIQWVQKLTTTDALGLESVGVQEVARMVL